MPYVGLGISGSDKKASNLVRDTVFKGNEDKYNTTKTLAFVGVASLGSGLAPYAVATIENQKAVSATTPVKNEKEPLSEPQAGDDSGIMLRGEVAGEAETKITTTQVEGKALQTYYPPNDGALGSVERKYLMPGDKIDRFGKLGGKYFSPVGTPMEMRALPSDADLSQYRVFEVVKPFEVESSTIAPAFNKIGLGTQLYSPVSAEALLKRGIIKIIP